MTEISLAQTLDERRSNYAKLSIYTGIGVLAVGGVLIIAFILTGASGNVIFRSLVTLALLTAFAFATIGENYSARVRAGWVTLVREVLLFLTLLAGIWHVWAPARLNGEDSNYFVSGGEFFTRTFLFVLTVAALQLAGLGFSILEERIRAKRISGPFLTVLGFGIGTFTAVMLMVSLGFTFPHHFFPLDGYWRAIAALGVGAVILIIIPVMARALNSENRRPAGATPTYQQPRQPAGWYPSADPAVEIFWNGEAWTSYSRPAGVDDELPPTVEEKAL